MLDEPTRVHKDIVMFDDNLKTLDETTLNASQQKTVELAKQYHYDAKYYHEKKDEFTAFGCINYAHGLLDALIKF